MEHLEYTLEMEIKSKGGKPYSSSGNFFFFFFLFGRSECNIFLHFTSVDMSCSFLVFILLWLNIFGHICVSLALGVCCAKEVQKLLNLFLHCFVASKLWNRLCKEANIFSIILGSCDSVLMKNSFAWIKAKTPWKCAVAALFWVLWQERFFFFKFWGERCG